MLFDLINASITFQNFINDVLRLFLNQFCSIYLNDVVVFSDFLSKHKRHVRQMIEALTINDLFLNLEKCKFHQQKVSYLDFIISNQRIKMNSNKVTIIAK